MKDLKVLIRAIKTVPLVQVANYSLPIISDDYYIQLTTKATNISFP